MIKLIRKYWHDPVWSKVIAGAILALAAVVGSYFLDWWHSIALVFEAAIGFTFSSTLVPNWLLGFLIVSFALLVREIAAGYFARKNQLKNLQPDWLNYTSDIFFGVKWGWKLDREGKVFGLYSLCPHCDYQIYPERDNSWGTNNKTHFHCENCNSNLGSHKDGTSEIENKVIRQIQRKLRTGEWIASTTI